MFWIRRACYWCGCDGPPNRYAKMKGGCCYLLHQHLTSRLTRHCNGRASRAAEWISWISPFPTRGCRLAITAAPRRFDDEHIAGLHGHAGGAGQLFHPSIGPFHRIAPHFPARRRPSRKAAPADGRIEWRRSWQIVRARLYRSPSFSRSKTFQLDGA